MRKLRSLLLPALVVGMGCALLWHFIQIATSGRVYFHLELVMMVSIVAYGLYEYVRALKRGRPGG